MNSIMTVSSEEKDELLQLWHKWDEVNLGLKGMNLFFDHLDEFSHVKKLNLSFNRLVTLPPEIGNLTALEELILTDNALEILPPELARLQNLKKLGLYGNNLHSLPDALSQLKNLQTIDLTKNQFTHIPPWLLTLPNLKAIYIEKNPLKEIDFGELRHQKQPFFEGFIRLSSHIPIYYDTPDPKVLPCSHAGIPFIVVGHESDERFLMPAPRPIDRYFGDIVAGTVPETYYPRIISDASRDIQKKLVAVLPSDHTLISPLRKALQRSL